MGEDTKEVTYKKAILKQLYFHNSLSCAELSDNISKSVPLTTRILNELIEEGNVVETGYAPSNGGRRPLMFSLKPNVAYIVSVAMDQFVTRIVIIDSKNHYATEIESVELPLTKSPDALNTISKRIQKIIAKSGIAKEKIIGVGVGMPGFVDFKKGINYTFLQIKNSESIADYLSSELELPVFIDNDSSLIGLAELRFGSARNKNNAMVINMGWGVGLGMILNGSLFRGQNGFAGEFSHIPLFTNGRLCGCGKTGCLETETSLSVIVEKARKGLSEGKASELNQSLLTAEHPHQSCEAVTAAARSGDRFAVQLFSESAYTIGRGVAILIHLLNPDIIILSGRGSLAGKVWEAPIQHALNEHCIPRLAANTEIEISSLGYEAELIGAAALVMENYGKISSKQN